MGVLAAVMEQFGEDVFHDCVFTELNISPQAGVVRLDLMVCCDAELPMSDQGERHIRGVLTLAGVTFFSYEPARWMPGGPTVWGSIGETVDGLELYFTNTNSFCRISATQADFRFAGD